MVRLMDLIRGLYMGVSERKGDYRTIEEQRARRVTFLLIPAVTVVSF
jgi:hypothetical protein